MFVKYFNFLGQIFHSPRESFPLVIAMLRGCFYICWFRVTQRNVIIKFPFLCHAKVEISGLGKVFIDRQCAVWMNTFEHLVIQTLSPEAEVRIGRNCTLGGLTIRCRGKVVLGDNVLTAANLVQDVLVASAGALDPPVDKPDNQSSITIGNDVWLGGQTTVLADSSIADGSVIGLNGLLLGADVKERCLAIGSPVMRPVPIDKIIKVREAAG